MAVHVKEALADSKHMPMWMDRPGRPEVTAALNENIKADLAFVKRSAANWPPPILNWLGANITFSALAKADRNEGKQGLWLNTLDRLGLGIHF
jgi:hypothetical protein